MNRVVITGMGAVTPLGNTVKDFWENSIAGKSGSAAITRFDATHFKTKIAAEVKDFHPEKHLDRNEINRSDLFTQYALYAATEAMHDSGLDIQKMDPFDIGVIWGNGQGGMGTFESEVRNFAEGNGTPRFSPFFVPKLITNMASGMISMKFGLMGINYTTVSACATGNTAIMDAFNYIRLGKAKAFITGASEAPITSASIGGFNAMKAMTTRNESPETASRPFDRDRDGFLIGEGAGALIIEDYEHAKARGATIYAELVGAGMTADAYHITTPHPEGIGAIKAMQIALHEAKLNTEDVDYVNMHATSTGVGDMSEVRSLQTVFKNFDNVKVSGTKSMTGHLLGAAGAVEAILSIQSLRYGIIPPTINIEHLDENIPANFPLVRDAAMDKNIQIAMSNAFGFGGHNGIVVFKKM